MAAPLCVAGVCDLDATCEVPVRSAGSGGEPEPVGPDCGPNVPVAARTGRTTLSLLHTLLL